MKSQVRIIGGNWRGRKLPVIDAEGLRPTPDRIRETLFNWLAPDLPGASLLDCFAGSGVLGFEALSRGARRVTALEKHPRALTNLQLQAERLQTSAYEIIPGDAIDSIGLLHRKYEVVFIDPPYAEPHLREQFFKKLEMQGCLRTGAKIYFEWAASDHFKLPAAKLRWLKQKSAGQVKYGIAEWR